MSLCEWRLQAQDSIALFMRAVKSLSTVDSTITIVIRPEKMDLYAESQDSTCAMMVTFPVICFSEFRTDSIKVMGVDSASLRGIFLPGKRSMLSIYFTIRNSDFLDFSIDYTSGVRGSYGLPSAAAHSAFQEECPEIAIYDAWMSARADFFGKHIVALFPGEFNFLALTISVAGMSVRNFDYEKGHTGKTGHPINIPGNLIPVFSPKKEVEITSLPYKRLKAFIEASTKSEMDLQFVPDVENNASQCILQAFKSPGEVYFTLLLGCDIRVFVSMKSEPRPLQLRNQSIPKGEEYFDVKAFRKVSS